MLGYELIWYCDHCCVLHKEPFSHLSWIKQERMMMFPALYCIPPNKRRCRNMGEFSAGMSKLASPPNWCLGHLMDRTQKTKRPYGGRNHLNGLQGNAFKGLDVTYVSGKCQVVTGPWWTTEGKSEASILAEDSSSFRWWAVFFFF